MKILAINSQAKVVSKKENQKNIQNIGSSPVMNRGLGYPKGFTPYFGARLFRTPENFYEQEFNKKGMPKTLSDYLNSNYEVNSKKPPMQLNKEAFADLELCESIEDVKEMFPDEPLFQNLQTLQTIRPKQGYLRDLRMVDTKNNEVLSNGEDLTVYLLKKVYLEGKDIDEINYDFKKDMKSELQVENATKDGAYFLHSTLRSLGVYLPDKSYWASLQATRTDKEYVPHVITVKTPHKKPVFTKPRVVKKPNLSPEERQRRRDMMINRWIEMSPAQRQKQLEKMKEGQENSVVFNHMSAIMLIATDRAKFSDKMFHFFQEKAKGVECPDDVNNPDDKQNKVIKQFWAENPKVRKSFVYHINSTIKEFEAAAEKGEDALTELLSQADKIRHKNEMKGIRRKYSNPETVKNELIQIMLDDKELLPESLKEQYKRFMFSNKRFKEEAIPAFINVMFSKGENKERATEQEARICKELDTEFKLNNKRDSISAIASLALYARPYIENIAEGIHKHAPIIPEKALDFISDKVYIESIQMLTGSFANAKQICDKYNITEPLKARKEKIDAAMKLFTKGFSDDEIRAVTKNFMTYISMILKNGNYFKLDNRIVRDRCEKYLPKAAKKIENNSETRRNFSKFLRDYEGLIRYSNEILAYFTERHKDPEKIKTYQGIRDYIYESIIDDYLIEKSC